MVAAHTVVTLRSVLLAAGGSVAAAAAAAAGMSNAAKASPPPPPPPPSTAAGHARQESGNIESPQKGPKIENYQVTAGFLFRAGAETPLKFKTPKIAIIRPPYKIQNPSESQSTLRGPKIEKYQAGSVGPRFPAGLPFPVPEILEFVAFGNSGKFSSNFPGTFPQFSSRTPERIPETATAFSSFLKNSEFFPERFWKISQGWIPKPHFWYPPPRFESQHRMPKHQFFLVSWISTADFGFSAGRRKVSDIFLRCLSRKSGSQHQLRIETLPSSRFRSRIETSKRPISD